MLSRSITGRRLVPPPRTRSYSTAQYKRGLLEAEVDALDRYAQEVDRLTMPVAFLHGTDDPFVPYERSLEAVRDMPSADLTVHVYEGARHEVLNETNRDEVNRTPRRLDGANSPA